MMPDRLLRDELLRSDRWLSLKDSSERLAFIVLLLTADAFGNGEATVGHLYRTWRDVLPIERDHVDSVLLALADRDLVRLYEVDGKRYFHIPRFRQELRYVKRLHPLSPWTTDRQKQVLAKNSRCDNDVSTPIARDEVKTSEVKKRKPLPRDARASRFDEFWKAYPKKKGRREALKAWEKINPDDETHARILAALAVQKQAEEWIKEDGKYVPYPAKWLNGERWNDEPNEQAPVALDDERYD